MSNELEAVLVLQYSFNYQNINSNSSTWVYTADFVEKPASLKVTKETVQWESEISSIKQAIVKTLQ